MSYQPDGRLLLTKHRFQEEGIAYWPINCALDRIFISLVLMLIFLSVVLFVVGLFKKKIDTSTLPDSSNFAGLLIWFFVFLSDVPAPC